MAEPKITLDEVLHVAKLARLQLSDEEADESNDGCTFKDGLWGLVCCTE